MWSLRVHNLMQNIEFSCWKGPLRVFISTSSFIVEEEFGVLIREVIMVEPEPDLSPNLHCALLVFLDLPSGIYKTVFGVRCVNTIHVRA